MTMTNTEILEKMAEQFMEPQVTCKLHWLEIDGTHGITFLEWGEAPKDAKLAMNDLRSGKGDTDTLRDALHLALAPYYEGTIQDVSTRHGFGARLSAPGYMDCTDWTVFETQEQAEQYLVDTYGDDIEEDETQSAEPQECSDCGSTGHDSGSDTCGGPMESDRA